MANQSDYVPVNILLTGGAGFIGSHVVRRLVNSFPEAKMVVLDALNYCGNIKNLEDLQSRPNFKFVKGNVANQDLIAYILVEEKIDTILHFAAETHVDNSFGNSYHFTESNVMGTHVMLESTRKLGSQIRRFIHVSTDEVYGENPREDADHKFHESSVLNPTNPYAATKACAEMLVTAYQHSYKLPCIITRGNNVYGPNQYPEKLIPKFLHLAMAGRSLPIHGSGSQRRSYLFVEDVARGFEAVLKKGSIGEVYHVGTSFERSVNEVARDICNLFGLDASSQTTNVTDRLFNDQRYFMDESKLKALGWSPEVSWEDGLKITAQWYKDHRSHWTDIENALLAHPLVPGAAVLPSPPAQVEEQKQPHVAAAAAPVAAPAPPAFRLLIFGKNGWLGGLLGQMCKEKGIEYSYATHRLEDKEGMRAELLQKKPTHVLNAAGKTGRPNVDWCESHQEEVLATNVVGVLNLADLCQSMNIHMTNYATGCIFEYDAAHPLGSGIGFKEEDKPNFDKSFYSKTKAMVEEMLKSYSNVLTLRVRMPISEDLEHPRNFIYKISRYAHVVDVPNSMTILPEMLPMSIEMARRKLTGIYNFTNPGAVSHNEILAMYAQYYKPGYTWKNFSLEEQAKILAAGRSNNELDTTKLKAEFPELLEIHESLLKYVFLPAQAKREAEAAAGKA